MWSAPGSAEVLRTPRRSFSSLGSWNVDGDDRIGSHVRADSARFPVISPGIFFSTYTHAHSLCLPQRHTAIPSRLDHRHWFSVCFTSQRLLWATPPPRRPQPRIKNFHYQIKGSTFSAEAPSCARVTASSLFFFSRLLTLCTLGVFSRRRIQGVESRCERCVQRIISTWWNGKLCCFVINMWKNTQTTKGLKKSEE